MASIGAANGSLFDAKILYEIGKFDEAARSIRKFLRINPKHVAALHWLGVIYFQTRQYQQAQEILGQALRIAPDFFEGLRIRALCLLSLQRYREAIPNLERASRLQPSHIEVLVNLGLAFQESGQPAEALASFDRALALDASNPTVWNNHGSALVALSRHEDALISFKRALKIAPKFETAAANLFIVQQKLGKVERIAFHALREMFDEVAPEFDAMMVDGLSYRAHLQVREMADRVLPARGNGWRILDIGCGPGLVGEAFADMARGGRLDGIDLAPKMIETARARGIYDELLLGDLEILLNAPGPKYDLIVSADTMIYLGDLGPTFRGAFQRLDPGGFYIFACEAKTGEGWEFTACNRFAHSEAYLRQEAARAGLTFLAITQNTLRVEKSEPVAGFAVALRKP
jgi:predicted TPR repeat methyltransferase